MPSKVDAPVERPPCVFVAVFTVVSVVPAIVPVVAFVVMFVGGTSEEPATVGIVIDGTTAVEVEGMPAGFVVTFVTTVTVGTPGTPGTPVPSDSPITPSMPYALCRAAAVAYSL